MIVPPHRSNEKNYENSVEEEGVLWHSLKREINRRIYMIYGRGFKGKDVVVANPPSRCTAGLDPLIRGFRNLCWI
jgi:hypothetical protein